MSGPRARVVLADDHLMLLEGLKKLLAPHFDVVGEAHDGAELLALLAHLATDVVLLDLSLPGKSGLELLPDVLALPKPPRVLILTMHTDRALAEAALKGGAAGFVPKDAGTDELTVAIAEVAAGRRYLSPRVHWTRRVGLGAKHLGLSRLTERQQEIVRLIGEGKSTTEIAAALNLRPSTVAFHRTNIRKALGIDTEWGLVRFAILTSIGEDGETGEEPR